MVRIWIGKRPILLFVKDRTVGVGLLHSEVDENRPCSIISKRVISFDTDILCIKNMGGDDSNSLLREAAPLRERTIPVYVASALIALLAGSCHHHLFPFAFTRFMLSFLFSSVCVYLFRHLVYTLPTLPFGFFAR